jgi:peptidoglycan/xylan/chitin deacetylase (PgdA/CDA1 family)
VYCGGRHGNAVALTFDDGPGPYTHFALKRLRRNNMRATFFLVARTLGMFGSLVASEQPFGEVGDHSRTHAFLPNLPAAALRSEVVGAQVAIENVAQRPVRLFRPPYGAHDEHVDSLATRHHMLVVLWNVDSADSLGANYKQITKNVIAGMHPGSIVLMHENRGQTIRALPTILHALRRRHLRAVTVPELLALDPPTHEQLSKGLAGCRHFRELGDTLTGGTARPD